ncbi:MAG: SIS domain-containing protein [Candidatus Xenobiia bacterium LiM19]
MADFFRDYFLKISSHISQIDLALLEDAVTLIKSVHGKGRKLILAGNGGSAAIASHVAVDLTKNTGIRAINFNEPDLITCFANDYGYERWVEMALKYYADAEDLLILISSSGCSPNILNAALMAREMRMGIVTFSGFSADNPLRKEGIINFWVDSNNYNFVEMTHHIWLLAITDRLVAGSSVK